MKATITKLFILSLFIYSCGSSTAEKPNKKSSPIHESVKVTFDIPSLIGKNIDQIVSILGKPDVDTEPSKLQLENDITEWDKTFTKDGFELLVTYNAKDRTVKDFFLSLTSSKIDDYKSLLKPSNLNENSTEYIIQPVYTKAENECTGITITSSSY